MSISSIKAVYLLRLMMWSDMYHTLVRVKFMRHCVKYSLYLGCKTGGHMPPSYLHSLQSREFQVLSQQLEMRIIHETLDLQRSLKS